MRKTQFSFQLVAFSVVKCINASYKIKFSLSPQNFGMQTARVTNVKGINKLKWNLTSKWLVLKTLKKQNSSINLQ